ncbi:MAG: guanylate kinase [Planctomycetota bacterium]
MVSDAPAPPKDEAFASLADAHDGHGFLVIVSGPSGVGKSSLVNAALPRLEAELSISMTTRSKRPGDVDGQHYHFVDRGAFEALIKDEAFLEWAEVYGNYYGTRRAFVQRHLEQGRLVVLEIDVEGAKQVKAKLPDAFAVFILAPDEDALLERLRGRKQDDEATIQKRFAQAKDEIARAQASGVYGKFIVNDTFDRAADELVSEIEQERTRRKSQPC